MDVIERKQRRKQEQKEMNENFFAKNPITIGAVYRDNTISYHMVFVKVVSFTKCKVKLDVYEPEKVNHRYNTPTNPAYELWDISPSYNNHYVKQITKSKDFIRCLHLCKMNETDVYADEMFLLH